MIIRWLLFRVDKNDYCINKCWTRRESFDYKVFGYLENEYYSENSAPGVPFTTLLSLPLISYVRIFCLVEFCYIKKKILLFGGFDWWLSVKVLIDMSFVWSICLSWIVDFKIELNSWGKFWLKSKDHLLLAWKERVTSYNWICNFCQVVQWGHSPSHLFLNLFRPFSQTKACGFIFKRIIGIIY